MRTTSEQYKQEMKQPWRGEWLFHLYIGAIDSVFQDNAEIQHNYDISFLGRDFFKYIFENPREKTSLKNIATFESEGFKADGSATFIDKNYEKDDTDTLATGYVSLEMSREDGSITTQELIFKSRNQNTKLKGITFDFGINHPTVFTLTCKKNGQEVFHKTYNNNQTVLTIVEPFEENITEILLKVTHMNAPYVRFRLQNVTFGAGMMFDNDDILLSNNVLRDSFSMRSFNLPTVDLTVSLQNYDDYYDFENPNSFINLYEKNQDAAFEILYRLENGEVESIATYELKLNDYFVRNETFVLNLTDFLRDENNPIEFTDPSQFPLDYYSVVNIIKSHTKDKNFIIDADPGISRFFMDFHNFKTTVKEGLYNLASAMNCTMILDGKFLLLMAENIPFIDENGYINGDPDKEVYYISDDLCIEHKPEIITEEKVKNLEITYTKSTKNAEDDYTTTQKSILVPCGDKGSDMRYDNPFITNKEQAEYVSYNLKKNLKNNVVYNIDYAGDPSLQVNDIIRLENPYNDHLYCIIESHEIIFTNGGLSGRIRARRI